MSTSSKLRRPRPPDKLAVLSKLRQFKSRGAVVRGRRPTRPQRRGTIVVLSAFLMVAMIAMVAFSVDVGALYVARTELQRAADSGALAAAAEMLESSLQGGDWGGEQDRQVRNTARQFVELNFIGRQSPTIDINTEQKEDGDLLFGEVANWDAARRTFQTSGAGEYNAVQVRVSRSDRINGEVPLFFAKIFGMRTSEVEARATAAFVTRMRGFRSPGNGRENLPLLPIAISEETLDEMLRGDGPDAYSWDNDTQSVTTKRDGRHEADLFPERSGAAGNWGLVDVGSAKSSPGTLQQQIRNGLTPAELDYHGGEIALDFQGELTLSGNPGLKIGVIEPALQSIVGQPRIVPVYSSASGGGTNAQYTITGFAGVCVVSVQLKSGNKSLRIQACPVITRGGIPAEGSQQTSKYIYSPVALVN
ncbi:MAG: pilus assembly protein TadG-related protein [Pirellulales bacterium]